MSLVQFLLPLYYPRDLQQRSAIIRRRYHHSLRFLSNDNKKERRGAVMTPGVMLRIEQSRVPGCYENRGENTLLRILKFERIELLSRWRQIKTSCRLVLRY